MPNFLSLIPHKQYMAAGKAQSVEDQTFNLRVQGSSRRLVASLFKYIPVEAEFLQFNSPEAIRGCPDSSVGRASDF